MRIAVVAALMLLSAAPARSASFTVDSTVDAPDTAPGDGACLSAGGTCTLRAAIQETNALPGADTVSVPAGTYVLAITGNNEDQSATGDLDVAGDLSLIGAGAATTIIDGGGQTRLLQVVTGTVLIQGVTLRNGNATQDDCDPALQIVEGCGGAVCTNGGDVSLRDVVVRDSTAFFGGGICVLATGTLALDAVTVANNAAQIGGGIIAGVEDFPTGVTVVDSAVSGNTATGNGGGGIASAARTLTITRSTISGNSATPSSLGGGGIWTVANGTNVIRNSTISGNTTSGRGGGILSVAMCVDPMTCIAGGNATLNNVTIAANTDDGSGAGVFNAYFSGPGPQPVLTASNSILAGNGPRDCGGILTSAGHDLIRNVDGCTIEGDTTGNVTGVDPLLGPLADNGGPTRTHALLGTAAVNAGNPAPVGSGGSACESTDQRGVTRPFGTACDIGAYESRCGDGIIDPGEQCDDGNPVDGDGCDTNCTFTGCGNGVVTAGEECDDANVAPGDCCGPTCQYEAAGSACPDDGSPCTDQMCDGAGHCLHPPVADGTACDDGNDCATGDFCRGGVCRPGPVCGPRFLCNGTACDDGDPCTQNDFCFQDVCVPGLGCGPCQTCSGQAGCVPANDGASCDDGDPCTTNDTCAAGACTPGSGCQPCATCQAGVGCIVPSATCTDAAPAGAALLLKHPPGNDRDAVRFKWRSSTPVDKTDFGDPTSTSSYRFCVFDGAGKLVAGADAPAGGTCAGRACWTEKTSGFSYRDPDGTPDGLSRIDLSAGDVGKLKLRARDPNLVIGPLPLLSTPVHARLSRTDTNACWEASFATSIKRNEATRFSAKSD